MTQTVLRGPTAKKLLLDEFGIKAKSIRRGRGTAYRWLEIVLEEGVTVDPETRDKIEKRLVEEHLCGTYYSDTGINDDWTPCVLWNR